MPYYQYEISVESSFKSQHDLIAIEKNEESQFHDVLSKPKNRIIDLLDLFFPPRFKKKAGRYKLYPTLPSTVHRKRTLEFLQTRIITRQIKLDCDIDKISGIDNLAAEKITPVLNSQYHYFKSYAFVEYDCAGNALVDKTTLLGSHIDTTTFVELIFECDLLPFELLNFDVILELYLQWNRKQLDLLSEKAKDEEGWLLIDAVSCAAGFYAMKSEVSSNGYINGFSLEIPLSEKPLRWRQEIPENKTESDCFQRPKGQIDNNKFPEKIQNLKNHWNKVFKNSIEAMKFGDINHTGGENVNRCNTRVREEQFFIWAKGRKYRVPSYLVPFGQSTPENMPKQKQQRTNLLHQCIADHRQLLINKTNRTPNNQAVWTSIYKSWKAGEIPFIDEIVQWGVYNQKIEWTSEHGNPDRPDIMIKKSFQTHMSKHFPTRRKKLPC